MRIRRIDCKTAKDYIRENHYSHGCHNGPSPSYGLFDRGKVKGVQKTRNSYLFRKQRITTDFV